MVARVRGEERETERQRRRERETGRETESEREGERDRQTDGQRERTVLLSKNKRNVLTVRLSAVLIKVLLLGSLCVFV